MVLRIRNQVLIPHWFRCRGRDHSVWQVADESVLPIPTPGHRSLRTYCCELDGRKQKAVSSSVERRGTSPGRAVRYTRTASLDERLRKEPTGSWVGGKLGLREQHHISTQATRPTRRQMEIWRLHMQHVKGIKMCAADLARDPTGRRR